MTCKGYREDDDNVRKECCELSDLAIAPKNEPLTETVIPVADTHHQDVLEETDLVKNKTDMLEIDVLIFDTDGIPNSWPKYVSRLKAEIGELIDDNISLEIIAEEKGRQIQKLEEIISVKDRTIVVLEGRIAQSGLSFPPEFTLPFRPLEFEEAGLNRQDLSAAIIRDIPGSTDCEDKISLNGAHWGYNTTFGCGKVDGVFLCEKTLYVLAARVAFSYADVKSFSETISSFHDYVFDDYDETEMDPIFENGFTKVVGILASLWIDSDALVLARVNKYFLFHKNNDNNWQLLENYK